MKDVWTFKSRDSKQKQLPCTAYAWVATQLSKMTDKSTGKIIIPIYSILPGFSP
jgi:histone arginine demethylase JMJD6